MTVSNQKYLKAVYTLSRQDGNAHIIDIAETLAVSKASACSAIQRLLDMGYVVHEFYGDVKLTAEGEKRAKAIITSYERMRASLGDGPLPEGLEYLLGTV